LDTSPGFLIRAKDAPHRTVLPNWDHETQVRIFPEPHPDGGFQCMREGSDDNNFGGAVWAEPVARSLGVKEQFTYIDRIPGVTGKTPTSRMVEALISLIEEKPRDVPESWIGWIKGGKNRAAKVQKIKTHIFWQGMEIMRKGKLLTNESGQLQPQFPALIMGAVSLQMSFEELANKRVEGFQGPMPESITADDAMSRTQRDQLYAQMFAIGDWCSIDHGRIVSIFQAAASGKFTMNHYSLRLMQEFPLTSIAQQVHQMWWPWDKLLRYHTVEEHMAMLCRAFPPEAVDYAFGTSELRDLMPDTFKDAWKRYRASQQAWAPGMAGAQGVAGPSGAPAPQQPGPQQMQQYPAPTPGQPAVMTGAPAPQQPAAAPPQMSPPAPQNTAAPAPTPPQSTAAPNVGGMAVNFSGAPVEGAQEPPPIMQSSGFTQQPPEFQQSAGAPVPGAPAAAPAPQIPAQTAPPATSTPAGAAPAVDQAALQKQLDALKGSRDQSSQGNS
jgi:hypothetical protein